MRVTLPSLILVLFLLAPAATLAENATPSSNLKDRQLKSASVSAKTLERKEKVASREGVIKLQRDKLKSALSARLKTHKDQKKAQIIERVDEMLNTVNTNRTEAMLKHLEKVESILTRVEERVDKAETAGKDGSSARGAIAQAKISIDQARVAALEQGNKDYTVSISSESGVRAEVKVVRDKLGTDLKNTHQIVKAAHDAVRGAIQAVNLLHGEKDGQ
ncbi:MAG: hypothetical protein Q7S88_00165 [Candidatus Daviesbacteria bacterium]|nr:hypothetical protein [Candidatus Daviesbacteria bacterium]